MDKLKMRIFNNYDASYWKLINIIQLLNYRYYYGITYKQRKQVRLMIADEILNGENKNIEYKRELPSKSDKYIKSLVAFANTSGGKLVIGIEDDDHEVIGVDEAEVFSMIQLQMLFQIQLSHSSYPI